MATSHGGGSSSAIFFELIVVLVLVFFAFWYMQNPSTPTDNSGAVTTPADNTTSATTPAKPINYTQALTLFKNARIQLGQDCQAHPNAVTFKNNTYIMIDNRASVSRSVRVGSVYNIPAYGFKVVKLSSSILPATWYVDCDLSQNVATVLIQK